RGEVPDRAEYLARFAAQAAAVDRAFGEDPDPPTTLRPGPPSSAETATARAIAGYEILGELGRGGMGVAYKAHHRQLDRLVALKWILAGELAGLEAVARFRAEARAAARVRHPGIVQVYEVGEHAGRQFVALEYVEGGSLAQRLAAA